MHLNSKQNYFLETWPSIAMAIKHVDAKTVMMELHYENDSMLMNNKNLPKFMTNVTQEPIIYGYNDAMQSPFMIIRYIDRKHNKEEKIQPDATSFIVLQMALVAHCGLEPMMFKYNWIRSETGHALQMESEMNVDGGVAIIDYVSKLIRGDLEGKKIR